MKILAQQVKTESAKRGHCAIYEDRLQRVWPINDINRESKIAQFAKKYGFRLRFYRKGLCAIFDQWPPPNRK